MTADDPRPTDPGAAREGRDPIVPRGEAPHDGVPAYADDDSWRIQPRVLVVDDEPSVVEVFREFLVAQGYDLTVASSGEEAVRIIPELRPEIILTDINLPGVSGLEVMRHAKRIDPEIVVIVVTGYASASTAIDALRQGAYDYVTKPFDLDEVHQIVERGIANRRLKAINRQLVEELRQKNEILERHENELRERVRLATWHMTRLYEVGKEISANLELAPRLEVICERAAELAEARAAVVFLQQSDLEGYLPAAAHGLHVGLRDEPRVLGKDDPLGMAAADQRALRRQVADGGAALELAALPGESFQSMLAIPLIAEGQSIGLLVMFDHAGGFTEADESFLALFASQAAIAVRNSQLYEHTKSLDRLKSEFVAVVSHEIRTPLTSVKGAVELLSDGRYFQNTEQQQKLLAIAHANAERLLVLINDILDFSKLESSSLSMSLEPQRLDPVIDQAAHNMRTLLEEHRIELDVKITPEMPDLLMDSNRIAQVLINLLSNAIKFSPPGGRILVSGTLVEDGVCVGVRDFGEGISPQDLPKLFRKFSQIDSSATRRAGGTGLGLVICKGIVEQHGGRIWVESAIGQGSTFYFTVPFVGSGQGSSVGRS